MKTVYNALSSIINHESCPEELLLEVILDDIIMKLKNGKG
jgi:hypothetical protein